MDANLRVLKASNLATGTTSNWTIVGWKNWQNLKVGTVWNHLIKLLNYGKSWNDLFPVALYCICLSCNDLYCYNIYLFHIGVLLICFILHYLYLYQLSDMVCLTQYLHIISQYQIQIFC
jgi:hypothetical protein